MSRVTRLLVVLGFVLACPAPSGASGVHAPARAALTIDPQMPSVGQRWHVRAALSPGDGLPHPFRRVTLTGEMFGHPMRPVEIELTAVDEVGTYAGDLRFTMRGSWQVTLRVEDLNDVIAGAFEVVVVREEEPQGLPELRSVLDLHPPVRPNLVSPAWVLTLVIGLTLTFEWTAAIVARRRARDAATDKASVHYALRRKGRVQP